ncbi:hypothetical protein [Actinomadura sp. 9N407]|uniref:Rv1733c family protein n=1 Tax=Actinomadura sp. 9N407 TaxID=3375154 RepID=UPI0037A8C3E5
MERRTGFRRTARNPLLREVDRSQRAVAVVLTALFVCAAPVLSVRAGGAAYERGVQVERSQAATRHRVAATVVAVEASDPRRARVIRVRWSERDGSARTGAAVVWRGRPEQGQTQPMWVDAAGHPTVRPRMRSQTVTGAALAGAAVAAGTAAPLLIVYAACRRRFDRRRYRDWENEWARLDDSRSPS